MFDAGASVKRGNWCSSVLSQPTIDKSKTPNPKVKPRCAINIKFPLIIQRSPQNPSCLTWFPPMTYSFPSSWTKDSWRFQSYFLSFRLAMYKRRACTPQTAPILTIRIYFSYIFHHVAICPEFCELITNLPLLTLSFSISCR